MPVKSKFGKSMKLCATCEFWNGTSIEVYDSNTIECYQAERAKCNKTGFVKAAWGSCNKHERNHRL